MWARIIFINHISVSMALRERLPLTRGIIFDLADTITETLQDHVTIIRRVSEEWGLDISTVDKKRIDAAISEAYGWLKGHQLQNNVPPSWGRRPEDWLEVNRRLYREIGFPDLSDETLIEMEQYWRVYVNKTGFETLTSGARDTLRTLHERGYLLGIASRREYIPQDRLERWEIDEVISTLQISLVDGYAKQSPYTLLKCAEELGVNPRRLAFVGNYVHVDVEAALRAEMVPILTTWSNPQEAGQAPEGCVVIGRITELLDLFPGPA